MRLSRACALRGALEPCPLKSAADLKGKRIAVGDQGSGTEVNARTLLEGFGITYDDVKVDYLGFADAADAMKAGKIELQPFTGEMIANPPRVYN